MVKYIHSENCVTVQKVSALNGLCVNLSSSCHWPFGLPLCSVCSRNEKVTVLTHIIRKSKPAYSDFGIDFYHVYFMY